MRVATAAELAAAWESVGRVPCVLEKLLPLALECSVIVARGRDGTVVNLAEMKPHSLDSHCSTRPVRFVLEMNTGWFSKRGVKPGAQLRGEPFGTPR